MIRLNKGAQPQVLVDNGASWTAEYVKWCENPAGTEPRRYAHSDIRLALELETNSKCAYCEGRSSGVAYMHIEHKIPKRKRPKLVCAWDNLTIACPKCNTNKGDYDEPECPLLDPYKDDVEGELVFIGPLALSGGGARAHATIARLELNRSDLVFERVEVMEGLDKLLDLVERAVRQPDVLRALWLEIDAGTGAKEEFSSARRQFLALRMDQRGLSKV